MYKVRNLVNAALCLAAALVLPFLTGQIPQIGSMLSPMHFPALICGFLCGWRYGLVVGFTAPLLRSAMFGMPPPYPTALAMAFELAVYGAASGLFYRALPKTTFNLYTSLVGAMLLGRAVWGVVMLVLTGVGGGNFTWAMFLAAAFLNGVPGIIGQIVLIPAFLVALKKAGYLHANAH